MSATWAAGYLSDIAYTLGFYKELAPPHLELTCLLNNVEAPNLGSGARYCELGCGRGYGTTLLAAANPHMQFVGIDFNPSHIAEARSLASRAEIPNVTFYEMGFGNAAQSHDPALANFEVIALHGVYSWVEKQVQEEIHQFLQDKLRAGGLVYVSYNTMPGWATALPIQRLVMEVAKRSARDSLTVINESLDLMKSLSEKEIGYLGQNPNVKKRIEQLGKQDKTYLAHEYINRGFQPLYVTDVMANLAEAKLSYIGSASLIENRIELGLPKELQEILRNAPDAGMRELLGDYIANRQFRRDVYIKGPQQLTPRDQRRKFMELKLISTLMGQPLPEKYQLPTGQFAPKKEVHAAIESAIQNHITTGSTLIGTIRKAGVNEQDAMFVLLLLLNAWIFAPARTGDAKPDYSASHRLNKAVMELAARANSHQFVASPVLGSAFRTSFSDRVFAWDLFDKSPQDPDSVARAAFDRLAAFGQSFNRDGKPLTKTPENVTEMSKTVQDFRDNRLPRWRDLGVVPK